jgi:hypothetical protein
MKKKSRGITSQKFIYEFDISHKKFNTKLDKRKHAIKIFNQFLTLYIKENFKKDSSYPLLTTTSFILKESGDKKHFFYNILTNPYNNHPFSLFGTYDDKIIYIMIPMGNSIGQFDISKIKHDIKNLSSIQKLGLYHLLKISIKIRETNFIKYTKPEVYSCKNITSCDKELNVLKAKNTLTIDLYNKMQIKYSMIVKNAITTYFNLLKKGKYNNAKDYIIIDNVNISKSKHSIKKSKKSKSKKSKSKKSKSKKSKSKKSKSKKSKSKKSKSKSKKNICLKNLLYNSKDIIGHLLIFIDIYKCIDLIKDTI